jgi:rare lipoprotein A
MQGCDLLKSVGTTTDNNEAGTFIAKGQASYYADKFHGRKTASGEVYDRNKLTAAHKTLPFQTKVVVKNLKNGKSTTVVINDRLPNSSSRVIDLSEAAAKQLDMIREGVIQVDLLKAK